MSDASFDHLGLPVEFVMLRRDHDGAEIAALRGCSVYVVVSTDGWTKREIAAGFREALTSVAGQGQNAADADGGEGTVTP